MCNKPNLVGFFYRKSTNTDLFASFFSFIPSKYKIVLVKTLLDRCYNINNKWKGFHNNLENLTKMLNKNQFPTKPINKVTKQYLNWKFDKKPLEKKT